MPDFLIQGLLTDLSIALLVGLFDGINREFTRIGEQQRRDDLIRRGYTL
jgi:vacuolar-type H+-ATPase catalytic subunit A/Vma1